MSLLNSSRIAQPVPASTGRVAVLPDAVEKVELRLAVARQLAGEGEEAIDDVLQETLLALHTAGDRAPEPEKRGAWLRQVAAHKVQDYWRRVERRRRLKERLMEVSGAEMAPEPSPFEWVIALESTRELHAALRRLPDDDRSLLEEKYLHGHSYERLAAERGQTVKTIEYRLLKARQAIRQFITREP
jgi:RNA polymerase sigma-70 factor (ECF subfamily)